MPHYGVFTIRDHSGEVSTTRFYNDAITVASLPAYLTEFGNLRGAIEGISSGVVAAEMWVGDSTILSQDKPTDPYAQRELKWLVTYEGNTSGKLFTMTIPCADLDAVDEQATPEPILAQDGESANLNCTLIQDFITAFETVASSPDNPAEDVTVRRMKVVGRNL